MGTNFYLHSRNASKTCECCGHTPPETYLHIGKSSAGWCFGLYVGRDCPKDLEGWKALWRNPDYVIKSEYDDIVSPERMENLVVNRRGNCYPMDDFEGRYIIGPKGLLRHSIDGRHCVGHGDGTYDLIAGEFS